MRKLIMTLAAMALVQAMTVITASAQSQGAHSLKALRNATPIVKEVGCRGPLDDANPNSMLEMLEKKGIGRRQVEDKLRTFAPIGAGQ